MMRLFMVLAVALLWTPNLAFAYGIGIYSDPAFTSCALADASPGLTQVHLVAEIGTQGATGMRFRVAATPGFTGTWVSESSSFVTVGTSPTDISMGLGICALGRVEILAITYQMFGTSTCSELSIAPVVNNPVAFCQLCTFGETPCQNNVPLHVNCPDPSTCNPLPTEPSTWGNVKALYRD